MQTEISEPTIWQKILEEVTYEAKQEPILASFYHATILKHSSLGSALSFHLANKLESSVVSAMTIREIVEEALSNDPKIIQAVCADIQAVIDRDPVCSRYSTPFLYFKGFQSLQAYRIGHWLWNQGRHSLALYLQHQISVVFSVDIHPAARIGRGIMIDHATGLVVGETCVIDDQVSILQSVTLGGTGKESGDRHPKIGKGVLISAGAKVLGNVHVGPCSKIGAGSVVLKDVPANTTVAGVPAKVLGMSSCKEPALAMDHGINDNHTKS